MSPLRLHPRSERHVRLVIDYLRHTRHHEHVVSAMQRGRSDEARSERPQSVRRRSLRLRSP
jgi:DNA primase